MSVSRDHAQTATGVSRGETESKVRLARMRPTDRQEWLFERVEAEHGGAVDVCNQAFVDDYIAATGAAYRPTMWGAFKCPQLGRDLSLLARKKYLKRGRVGLWNMGGMGFPRWVWVYRLSPWYRETRALRTPLNASLKSRVAA